MSDRDEIIDCARHGKSYPTFVCHHLAAGANRGFYCAEDEGDPKPDAWCLKCNELLMANGGEWNEEAESYAQITLLCAHCYDTAKVKNQSFRQSLQQEGWELCEVAERMSDYPDLNPPSLEELRQLKPGDTVKLIFDILGEDASGEFIQGERMWVSIEEKTEQGYRGSLDNEPTTAGSLYCGANIVFEEKHIAAIYKPANQTRKNSPTIRRIEKGKIQ
jgi:hypothetical protein